MKKIREQIDVKAEGDKDCDHVFLGDSVKEASNEGDLIVQIIERKCVKCGRIEILKEYESL